MLNRHSESDLDGDVSSSETCNIASMTYSEAFALRDDRTKPTGKYLYLSGGKISQAVPMSYLDWAVKRSSSTPAADHYQRPLKPRSIAGGQFSTAYPQTEIEHIVAHSDETPGPSRTILDLCHRDYAVLLGSVMQIQKATSTGLYITTRDPRPMT